MKKIFLLGAALVLMLCGCARPIDPSFDLAMVGSLGTSVPFAQPESYAETPEPAAPSAEAAAVSKLSARTERVENQYYTSNGQMPLFFSSIRHTTLDYPTEPKIAARMNRELEFQFSEKRGMAENYLETAEEMYEASLHEPDAAPFYEFSYYANDSICRLDEKVFSLATYYSCYLGGIHPENLQVALNYDMRSSDRLSLGAVLTPSGRNEVCEKVLERLNSHMAGLELFADYESSVTAKFGEAALDMQWDNWFFTEKSLVLFLNPYEISPYAAGVVSVEFTGEEYFSMVKPEFLPLQNALNASGAFYAGPVESLLPEGTEAETVPLGNGKCSFAILCRAPVYDLSLYYGLWAGEEPSAREILYRATCLSGGEVLTIELDGAEESTNLCIRLDPGDGIFRTVQLTPDVLNTVQIYSFGETDLS